MQKTIIFEEEYNDFCASNFDTRSITTYRQTEPPEILYHERQSLIQAIKAELNEDTQDFLEMLTCCSDESLRFFCNQRGELTKASITTACLAFGLSSGKLKRIFSELKIIYDSIKNNW